MRVHGSAEQKATALDLFVEALTAERLGETRRRISMIAVAFGVMDELLYALGNNVLADLIGDPIERGAGDGGLLEVDDDGDPLDGRGRDGGKEDEPDADADEEGPPDGDDDGKSPDEKAEPETPVAPPLAKPVKCEWCAHRVEGLCDCEASPFYAMRVALGGTCSEFAPAGPPKNIVGGRTACPECGKLVTIQAACGPRYKLRPHRSAPGVNCQANVKWFGPETPRS